MARASRSHHTILGLLLWTRVGTVDAKASGCTTILVSRAASADGNAMTSHAADSDNADFRVAYVPAKDHAPDAVRKVYRGDADYMMYPRIVDLDRSPQYVAVADPVHPNEVIGTIPEVPHTYALWEGLYGMMNEHGLAIGESTCEGRAVGVGVTSGGSALFTIGNLVSIVLERCKTSTCAVETMGDLAERYGFYGEDDGVDGAGEALTIADADGDAWAFQIAGGVPNRTGALWVAQRVADGHVAVVANSFTIQEVDLSDGRNFRGTKNLLEHAKAGGYWDGRGKFNWQRAMAPDVDENFEANLNMFDTLRMWRVFTLVAPNCGLQPSHNLTSFPFSVAVEKKISLDDVFAMLRDTYEDTMFDMRLGTLAGPWQTTRRYDGARGSPQGQSARSISVSWSAYSWVAQPSVRHPVLWYAADSAKTSVFVPFYTEGLRAGGDGLFDAKHFGSGSMLDFSLVDLENQPAWWAFSMVADWMQISYANMSQTYVFPKVEATQRYVLEHAQASEREAEHARSNEVASKILAVRAKEIQEHVTREWWDLASMLVQRYKDQKFNFPPNARTESAAIPVPAYWQEMMGFNPNAVYPCWARPSHEPPNSLPAPFMALAMEAVVQVQDLSEILGTEEVNSQSEISSVPFAVVGFAICGLVGAFIGHTIGYKKGLDAGSSRDRPYKVMVDSA